MKTELENLIKDLVILGINYYNYTRDNLPEETHNKVGKYNTICYYDVQTNNTYWHIEFVKEDVNVKQYDQNHNCIIECDYAMITIPKLTKLLTKYRNQLNKLKSKKNDRTK